MRGKCMRKYVSVIFILLCLLLSGSALGQDHIHNDEFVCGTCSGHGVDVATTKVNPTLGGDHTWKMFLTNYPDPSQAIPVVLMTDLDRSKTKRHVAILKEQIKYYNALTIKYMPKLQYKRVFRFANKDERNDIYKAINDRYPNVFIFSLTVGDDETLREIGAAGYGGPSQDYNWLEREDGFIELEKTWNGGFMAVRSAYFDREGKVKDVALIYIDLFLHELGHVFGLSHAGILEDAMSYSDHYAGGIKDNGSSSPYYSWWDRYKTNFLKQNYQKSIANIFRVGSTTEDYNSNYVFLYPRAGSTFILDDSNVSGKGYKSVFLISSLKGFDAYLTGGEEKPLTVEIYLFINNKYRLMANFSEIMDIWQDGPSGFQACGHSRQVYTVGYRLRCKNRQQVAHRI
jgi:hypothetical protein